MKERAEPRISVHKLGTYVDSSGATTREKILRDQKFPAEFQSARYRDATEEIRRALLSAGDARTALVEGEQRIRAKVPKNTWAAQAQRCSADAISHFAQMLDDVALDGLTLAPSNHVSLVQRIEGVGVSVRPLIVLSQSTATAVRHGALLLVTRKEDRLSAKSGKAVAALLARALVAAGRARSDVDPSLCVVVDVFHRGIFRASIRDTVMMREVHSACLEIAQRWPFIARTRAA